jgi:hypothetical protein
MNKLLLTLSLVFLTTLCFAQTLNFGVKAGVNLSMITGNTPIPNFVSDPQNKSGFQAVVVANIGFQHFDIQPGCFYNKGPKIH